MCIDESVKCGGPDPRKWNYDSQEPGTKKDREEILSKFENGNERYIHDALTGRVVDALIHGIDPIKLIGQLLQINNNIYKQLVDIRQRLPVSYNLTEEQANEFLKTMKNKL